MSGASDHLRVVLVGAGNPLNIGAAARAMSNFGFLRLRVVNAYDVAFREAKSAVGAASVLTDAEEFTKLSDAVADCTLVVGTTAVRHRELQHPLRRLEYGARLIRKELATRTRCPGVRPGEDWPFQRRPQLLPLADEHSHARAAHLDEPGTGRCGVPVRTGARCEEGRAGEESRACETEKARSAPPPVKWNESPTGCWKRYIAAAT